MRTTDECMRLLAGHIVDDVTIDDYIQRTRIDEEGTGVHGCHKLKCMVLAHMTGLNIFSQARMNAYTYCLGILLRSDIQMI